MSLHFYSSIFLIFGHPYREEFHELLWLMASTSSSHHSLLHPTRMESWTVNVYCLVSSKIHNVLSLAPLYVAISYCIKQLCRNLIPSQTNQEVYIGLLVGKKHFPVGPLWENTTLFAPKKQSPCQNLSLTSTSPLFTELCRSGYTETNVSSNRGVSPTYIKTIWTLLVGGLCAWYNYRVSFHYALCCDPHPLPWLITIKAMKFWRWTLSFHKEHWVITELLKCRI